MKSFKGLVLVACCFLLGNLQALAEGVDEMGINSDVSVSPQRVRISSPHIDVKIKFLRCIASGNTVLLDLEVTKRGGDAKINFGSVSNVAIDDRGKQYKMEYSVGGGKWRSGYSSEAELFLADVPTAVSYRINNVSERVNMFRRINLKVYSPQVNMSSEPVKIMNVPIEREEIVEVPVSSMTQKEDFLSFEKRFVSDAEFQLSRIIFNDLGYKSDDDPESVGEKWSPENWNLFKNTLDDVRKMGQFKTKRELISDKCVQTIWIESSGFLLEHTYTRINGKWYLTKVIERI